MPDVSRRCPDCGVVLQHPGTDKWMPIEEGTTAHTKERCLEHQLAAARTEAERWKQQYEALRAGVERVVQVHRRIKGLEAKIGRQRAVISRLQAAVERRNSDERVEAMRRALYDETVERYMREYDAAADEAERLKADLAAAHAVIEAARRVVNNKYDVDPADVYELREAIRRYDERRGGVSR